MVKPVREKLVSPDLCTTEDLKGEENEREMHKKMI
jgi:hypothetical protein